MQSVPQAALPAVLSARDARVCIAALETVLRLNDLLAECGYGAGVVARRDDLERILRELGGGS